MPGRGARRPLLLRPRRASHCDCKCRPPANPHAFILQVKFKRRLSGVDEPPSITGLVSKYGAGRHWSGASSRPPNRSVHESTRSLAGAGDERILNAGQSVAHLLHRSTPPTDNRGQSRGAAPHPGHADPPSATARRASFARPPCSAVASSASTPASHRASILPADLVQGIRDLSQRTVTDSAHHDLKDVAVGNDRLPQLVDPGA